MDSSAGWLILGPGRSLALQLVDAGFDVFLGNTRGNRYSRNHTTLDSTQLAFWAWSWQQQAEYDLPASLSYVLEATQQQRLVYIGYSQVWCGQAW
jgi:predicted alpha/beta hydrolase